MKLSLPNVFVLFFVSRGKGDHTLFMGDFNVGMLLRLDTCGALLAACKRDLKK